MKRSVKIPVFIVGVALLTLGCSAGQPAEKPATQPASTPSATQVTIKGFAFDPAQLTVSAGTTVTWTNQDSAAHSATSDDGSWDSGLFGQGGTYSHTFSQPGTLSYYCTIHPSMKGTIVVTQ